MRSVKPYLIMMLWTSMPALAELDELKAIPIIAPAGPVSKTDYGRLCKVFPALRLRPFTAPVYWHSGSDQDRALELVGSVKHPSPWVWSLRGGYGCARLIPFLEKAHRKGRYDAEKIWIGYSDCTCLHLWAHLKGAKTLHASMPKDWINPLVKRKNFILLNRILQKPQGRLTYSGLTPLNAAGENTTSIQGVVLGGNLTLLANSIGTVWQLKGREKIIIIEDVDMLGYQIDRTLHHLTESGVLEGAKTIIFGEFSGKNTGWKRALERFAQETSVPVFYWPYFGHGPNNYPIPLGFESTITLQNDNVVWVIPYHFL
jgi:muramoyltetrapeptide carboxypeptidase